MAQGYNWAPLSAGLNAFRQQQNLFEQQRMQEAQQAQNQQYRNAMLGQGQQRIKMAQDAAEREAKRAALMDPLRMRLLKAQAAQAEAGKILHVGNTVVRQNPDGTITPLYKSPLTPSQLMDQYILQQLNPQGGTPGAAPVPPGQPQLRPQSFNGAAPEVGPQPVDYNGEPTVTDPRFIRTQAAGQQPQQPGGMFAGMTPQQRARAALAYRKPGFGNFLLKQDQADPTVLTAPTKNRVQTDITNADDALTRLTSIQQAFKPEYLQTIDRLGFTALQWKSRLPQILGKLTPQEQEAVRGYAEFRRSSAENVNLYIKEITGAQMSEAEAKRLMLAQANAGQGLFDGQDPVTFKSNLEAAIQGARLARARKFYLLKQGKIGQGHDFRRGAPISLDKMQNIMRMRRKKLLQDASRTYRTEEERRAFVVQQMQSEFGI